MESEHQSTHVLQDLLSGSVISRRRFLATVGAVGGGLLLVACGSDDDGGAATTTGGSGGEGAVVVVDGGGSYHNALNSCCYLPYAQESGARLTSTSYDYSLGAIQAQVDGAKEWDVVVLGQSIDDATAARLFQPIDYSVVNTPGIARDGKFRYFVEDASFSHVVGYDTRKFKTPPRGWADFWDVDRFPGARGLYNWPVGTLEIALLADGVAPAELYPLDLDRAFASIDTLRKSTEVRWYLSGTEQIQFFTDGLAPMVAAWAGRILAAAAEGVPIDYQVDGALPQASYLAVLKTAPHPKQAFDYIRFKLQPETSARNAVAAPGDSPGNTQAFRYIDKALAAKLPTNPALRDRTAGSVDARYWAKNFDANLRAWQDYTSKL
jgi:putative spermidine/putrescine transport system substrate-binding protein